MTDINGLIERLEADPVMVAAGQRNPKSPEFFADQNLVDAVEQKTDKSRVMLADAVSFAEGFAAAVATLRAMEGGRDADPSV